MALPIPMEVLMGTITGGAIAGYVMLVVVLLACVAVFVYGWISRDDYATPSKSLMAGGVIIALITVGLWWACMAFTTSGDYHAWNVKEGNVDRVAKRLIATDNGMSERYVVTMDGQSYGIDDTRAALVQQGDTVSLRCKKDYQWGVPREAHGWACRWNTVPGS